MLQRLIRPIVTILLLFVCLFLSVAPRAEAGGIANGSCSHPCCRRKATHCGHRSHPDGGPSWVALRPCGNACLSIGLPCPISPAVLKKVPSAALPRLILKPESHAGLHNA